MRTNSFFSYLLVKAGVLKTRLARNKPTRKFNRFRLVGVDLLDVIGAKGDLQVAQHLSRRRVAHHLPLLEAARGFRIQIGFELPQIIGRRLLGGDPLLLRSSYKKTWTAAHLPWPLGSLLTKSNRDKSNKKNTKLGTVEREYPNQHLNKKKLSWLVTKNSLSQTKKPNFKKMKRKSWDTCNE